MSELPDERMAQAKAVIGRAVDQLLYMHNPQEECPFFPSHVHFEPTNACNLRCIHCHHHPGSRRDGTFTRPLGTMDFALYAKLIDEIAPLGCRITLDSQGEPTLHPDLVEMIAYAKKKHLHTSLLTNGTRLAGLLADQILDSGVDRVVFSFDAVDKGIYEAIRVHGDFDATLANILRFIHANHGRGHRIFVCMSVIVQERTRGHLQAYRDFFKDKPVDTIFENNLLNLSGGSGVAQEICTDRFRECPTDQWPICRVPWENLAVNWDGLVSICPLDYDGRFIVGDARETTLQQIWNSDGYRRFRRAHLQREYAAVEAKGPLCSLCNCLWDPEYDIRNYPEYAKRNLTRVFSQLLRGR